MKTSIICTLMCFAMVSGLFAQEQNTAKKSDKEQNTTRKEMVIKHHKAKHLHHRMKKDAITPEQRAERKVQFLTRKLSLTQEQSDKLHKLFLKENETFGKLRAAQEKAESARHDEMKKLKANTDKQIKKILTDEQYSKYQQLAQERKKHHDKKHLKRG